MWNPFRKKKQENPYVLGMIRGVRTRDRRTPGWLRVFSKKWVLIPLVILLLLGAAGGYVWWRYNSFARAIQNDKIPVPDAHKDETVEPFNVLLVGSDSRAGLTEEEQERLGADDEAAGVKIEGERADTLILAHVDPRDDRITMLQFPRDYYVPLASGGKDKINEALEKGAANLIDTVHDLTGLEIDHYAQVNIAGFRDIVDAIDGVRLCITEPIPFDKQTGIEITEDELPVVEFDGERALRFVRSRNFATGDFQRIQNQQKFLSAAVSKLTSPGVLLDIGGINRILRAVERNLQVDKHTSPRDLYNLGQRFRSFDPERYEAYTAPSLGYADTEEGNVVVPDLDTLDVITDAIAANESPQAATDLPDVPVNEVRVSVLNGTGEAGVAAAATKKLLAAMTVDGESVEIVEQGNAERFNFKGVIVRYDPSVEGAEDKAELVAAAIPGAKVRTSEGVDDDADVEVVVGKGRFRTEKLIRVKAIELPPPGTAPEECRRELG